MLAWHWRDAVIVLGIVGTESTHVPRFLELLNDRAAQPGVRVGALWGHDRHQAGELAARYAVDTVVADPERMLGSVDAVVVADRDGDDHLRHAAPFLTAGLPVYVNKPLSRSVADAETMIAMARRHSAPLTSFTPLRWLPEITELTAAGQPSLVVTSGPADPASPHGGIGFYAVHAVELALHLAGGGPTNPVIERISPDVVVVNGVTRDGVALNVALLRPGAAGSAPFHAQLVTRDSVVARTIRPTSGYLAWSLERFVTMIRTGQPVLPYSELLCTVRVLAAVDAVCGPPEPTP